MLLTKIHALFTFPYINLFCLPYGLPPYHFILIICHVVLGFWVLTFWFFLVLMPLTILEILVRSSVMSLCGNLLMFTSWLDWGCGMERKFTKLKHHFHHIMPHQRYRQLTRHRFWCHWSCGRGSICPVSRFSTM